jgi:hypothetical protein
MFTNTKNKNDVTLHATVNENENNKFMINIQ